MACVESILYKLLFEKLVGWRVVEELLKIPEVCKRRTMRSIPLLYQRLTCIPNAFGSAGVYNIE